jgi:hypothetical protein
MTMDLLKTLENKMCFPPINTTISIMFHMKDWFAPMDAATQ